MFGRTIRNLGLRARACQFPGDESKDVSYILGPLQKAEQKFQEFVASVCLMLLFLLAFWVFGSKAPEEESRSETAVDRGGVAKGEFL